MFKNMSQNTQTPNMAGRMLTCVSQSINRNCGLRHISIYRQWDRVAAYIMN